MTSQFIGFNSADSSQKFSSQTQADQFAERCPDGMAMMMMMMGTQVPFPPPTPNVSTRCQGYSSMTHGLVPSHSFEDPVDKLKIFLASAPTNWEGNELLRRFPLGNGETIACVLWKGQFYITGTDIVKILLFRFQFIQRPIINTKKFEEGVFSDLRNLKPGIDAALEEPRSEFLEILYRNGCIRTQKKQKVFFWYSVPHEKLFIDALDRNLKRESNLIHVNAFLGRHQPFPFLSQTLSHKSSPLQVGLNVHSTAGHQQDFAPHAPPMLEPQPIKPLLPITRIESESNAAASSYSFSHSNLHHHHPSSISQPHQYMGKLQEMSQPAFSITEDYFSSDSASFPFPSNFAQNSQAAITHNTPYASVPKGAVRRPDLFDTFI